MSNWFQENPVMTILGHTIVVATTTWLVSSFIIDENKVNLYKAIAENATAQIKNEQAIAEQFKAKVSALEANITELRTTNQRYLSWLSEEPRSFPSLEKKISMLETQLNTVIEKTDKNSKSNPIHEVYEFKSTFHKGGTFVDPKTSATLGVSEISPSYTITGVLFIPGREKIQLNRVRPGETWVFEDKIKKYKLTLLSVNWIDNSIEVSVIEIVNTNENKDVVKGS